MIEACLHGAGKGCIPHQMSLKFLRRSSKDVSGRCCNMLYVMSSIPGEVSVRDNKASESSCLVNGELYGSVDEA